MTSEGIVLEGRRVLVTGATGQVGLPVAKALAAQNEVAAAARFKDAGAKAELEAAGARCVTVNLVAGDVSQVPEDLDYVLHFAVAKSNNWDKDLAGNAEGVGLLMARCRNAKAFLHCSSTGVYQPDGHRHFAEDDALGDNHRVLPFLETYSITKIAAEAVARTGARLWDLPTTIARLNVPYGDNGGWPAMHLEMMLAGMAVPVHVDAPSLFNPIHEDDVVAHLPRLLAVASVPATTVNWGGDDVVSVEDWCAYLAELTGLEARLEPTAEALQSVAIDVTRQHELIGGSTVGWQEGMRRMVEARHPELLRDRTRG
jgi:UDP-glucuronate 4-epimerase